MEKGTSLNSRFWRNDYQQNDYLKNDTELNRADPHSAE
jgi:hypothetical protein